MTARLQPKQIEDYKIARMGVVNFAGAGTSDVVTTEISSAAGTDGVPVQVGAATTQGFITTGANNKVLIFDTTSKTPLLDGAGNEVFGRLTEAASIYTLSYFSIISGTETAYTLPATNIDFYVAYNYDFVNIPNDALIRVRAVQVGEDPSGSSGRAIRNEQITVTALNTINDFAFLPIDNTASLFVNGKEETEGASFAFTRVGKVITWNPSNAEYDLTTGDKVIAHYNTHEL